MTYRPNSNNIIFFRGRGLKRAKKNIKLKVRFNNATGCRQVVCKKNKGNKCKFGDFSSSQYVIVGHTKYYLNVNGNQTLSNPPNSGWYVWNQTNGQSAWFLVVNNKLFTYTSTTNLNNCFPYLGIF